MARAWRDYVQAFERAGARAVLASLWSVADRESAQLMAGFFDNLATGQGKAEALRQAATRKGEQRLGGRRRRRPIPSFGLRSL